MLTCHLYQAADCLQGHSPSMHDRRICDQAALYSAATLIGNVTGVGLRVGERRRKGGWGVSPLSIGGASIALQKHSMMPIRSISGYANDKKESRPSIEKRASHGQRKPGQVSTVQCVCSPAFGPCHPCLARCPASGPCLTTRRGYHTARKHGECQNRANAHLWTLPPLPRTMPSFRS